jgi:hypothetical protein
MLNENKIVKNLTGRGAAIRLQLTHHIRMDGTSDSICHHTHHEFTMLEPHYI